MSIKEGKRVASVRVQSLWLMQKIRQQEERRNGDSSLTAGGTRGDMARAGGSCRGAETRVRQGKGTTTEATIEYTTQRNWWS